jgi:hypothetical protein
LNIFSSFIVPKNSTTFYFNCSKIEPTPESYSF